MNFDLNIDFYFIVLKWQSSQSAGLSWDLIEFQNLLTKFEIHPATLIICLI